MKIVKSIEVKMLLLSILLLGGLKYVQQTIDLKAFILGALLLSLNTRLIKSTTASALGVGNKGFFGKILPFLQLIKFPLFFLICAWIFPKFYLDAHTLLYSLLVWVLALFWQGMTSNDTF